MRKHLDSVALQNAFQKDVEERVKKEKAAINSTSPFEVRSLLVDPELYHLHAVITSEEVLIRDYSKPG